MNEVLYEETQRFAIWVYILMFVLVFGLIAAYVGSAAEPDDPANEPKRIGAGLFVLAVLLLICNLLLLRARVRENDVYVSLGALFPMLWRRIKLDAIVEERVVTYRPIRDAGGWGWRLGMFEKTPTSFLNARGNRGVLLTTNQRPVIIGSQDPDALAKAIARARDQFAKFHGPGGSGGSPVSDTTARSD